MIPMNNWAMKAAEKLAEDRKVIPEFNSDKVTKELRDSKISQKQKEAIMADARVSIVADTACDALSNFCRQNETFAKAVVEGGSLSDCVKQVMGDTVYAISDLDIFKKCAEYYFPSAKIGMVLTIDTAMESNRLRTDEKPGPGKMLSLKLDDFLL